jgi:hypothetical protein
MNKLFGDDSKGLNFQSYRNKGISGVEKNYRKLSVIGLLFVLYGEGEFLLVGLVPGILSKIPSFVTEFFFRLGLPSIAIGLVISISVIYQGKSRGRSIAWVALFFAILYIFFTIWAIYQITHPMPWGID